MILNPVDLICVDVLGLWRTTMLSLTSPNFRSYVKKHSQWWNQKSGVQTKASDKSRQQGKSMSYWNLILTVLWSHLKH